MHFNFNVVTCHLILMMMMIGTSLCEHVYGPLVVVITTIMHFDTM